MDLSKAYEATQTLSDAEAKKLYAQLPDCEVASTTQQSEDEEKWVQERLLGIGGSDIGSICGVNKYSSPRLIYLSKMGLHEPNFSDEAKERMAWGHKLEPIVADEFTKRTGQKVVIASATFRSKVHPWARANVDRFIVDDNNNPIGILECKTANWRLNEDWANGDIPVSYIYQLQWYLAVTGLKYGAFAALVGGNNYHYYEVFANEELINTEMIPKADNFWNNHVLKGIEPPITGIDADVDYVKETYEDVVKNSEVQLKDEKYNELAEVVFETKQQMKELKKVLDEAENQLKESMGTNEIGYTADRTIKWSPRTQQRVDNEKLKTQYPEIYNKVKKQISYRVFSVK